MAGLVAVEAVEAVAVWAVVVKAAVWAKAKAVRLASATAVVAVETVEGVARHLGASVGAAVAEAAVHWAAVATWVAREAVETVAVAKEVAKEGAMVEAARAAD